jgi:hypothetical protein
MIEYMLIGFMLWITLQFFIWCFSSEEEDVEDYS